MQASRTLCKHLIISPGSWFHTKVKGSEQNARGCVPTQGEVRFTLPERAKTQISYSKTDVYVTSVINEERKLDLVGKSAHPNRGNIFFHSSMGGIYMTSLDQKCSIHLILQHKCQPKKAQ